jgi:hypothetical protein
MKIRISFVSNSSSSSFVLDKQGMTIDQINVIKKWIESSISCGDDTIINESNKHFYGQISHHINPSLEETMEINGISKDLLDKGD